MEKESRLIEIFYRSLYRIRRVEEEIVAVYPTDKIKSPVHLSIGQEFVSVGVCEALRPSDAVFGTYRGHALYLAKGGDLRKMIAELYGKQTGCAKGKGGSMHLADAAHGVMGTSAIVGTTIPVSVGYAYALKLKRADSVAVCFFGDGAVDEGNFHESLNFAALKNTPVLFVCENNFYAIHSHHLTRHHSDNLCERARAYGMPAVRIEGGDVFKVYDVARDHIERMRRGESGPVFLEVITCRWKEHVGPGEDFHLGYREEQEVACWIKGDQVPRVRGMLDEQICRIIENEVEQEISKAFRFAEESRFPEAAELYKDLYKE
ncbi:MAG: thiamine pyrophosphate-dependent dehydrogenase E1 component subunit alpha [Nitrospirae bacterium]|nr:MAG: thiamine pyrophosphate-dependent dehydrogenase E1 component subunit alpha [Nitrospirota bacterium]